MKKNMSANKRWFIVIAVFALLISLIVFVSRDKKVQNTEVQDTGGNALLVLLHGYTLDGQSLDGVEATVRQVPGLTNASLFKPSLPLSMFSMSRPDKILADLLVAIDQAWDKRAATGKPYDRIVLVGHSAGALYARKLYVAACGQNDAAPFEKGLTNELANLKARPLTQARPWAAKVDRIILLAGMNRGWSISHHMSLWRAASMKLGAAIGHCLEALYRRPPIIFTIRRGSSFITELRLQWLAMRAGSDPEIGHAPTIQLLGTIDDLVSPDDNVDLVSGRDFTYLEMPHSGHKNVIEMDSRGDDQARKAAAKRRDVLLQAMTMQVPVPGIISPVESNFTIDTNVTDVVFVIHGIRDEGHWTRKIAYRAQVAGQSLDRKVATVTSSYGYFPMLSFLRPGARQQKVAWMMDRYTEARAQYPNATHFHYVGHSHGTYLLAKALEDHPAVRFNQVVFAGSVVRRAYPWGHFIKETQQVKNVLNFVATADWVVAFFPKALQSVGLQDLGSAGHDGFDLVGKIPGLTEPRHPDLKTGTAEPAYLVGGHSAALTEAMWDAIAHFTMTGTFKIPEEAEISTSQAALVAGPALVAPIIWIGLASALVAGLWGLISLRVREWKKTVLIIGYCSLVWTILTKL
jgi:pimeloyl-ACP methyl ester carboxylesterase